MITTSVFDCKILELPKIYNRAGNITALNNGDDISFNVKRVYYLYDIPGGEDRGGHAHRELYQLIIAVGGSFDVHIDDGIQKKIIGLNRPNFGLYMVPGIWRELTNFSSGAICLVLASTLYSEADYIRDYETFKKIKNDTSNI